MKKLFLVSLIVLSTSLALAAKLNQPACKDLVDVTDKLTPEYLAVVDGYNKTGKPAREEIDLAQIVNESHRLKDQCAKDASVKIENALRDLKKLAAPDTSSSETARLNPTKAKCQDFIALREAYQPVAAFWVAGYSRAGKVKNGEVDEEYLERPLAALIQDCKKAPTASFYEKAKMWVRDHI